MLLNAAHHQMRFASASCYMLLKAVGSWAKKDMQGTKTCMLG